MRHTLILLRIPVQRRLRLRHLSTRGRLNLRRHETRPPCRYPFATNWRPSTKRKTEQSAATEIKVAASLILSTHHLFPSPPHFLNMAESMESNKPALRFPRKRTSVLSLYSYLYRTFASSLIIFSSVLCVYLSFHSLLLSCNSKYPNG